MKLEFSPLNRMARPKRNKGKSDRRNRSLVKLQKRIAASSDERFQPVRPQVDVLQGKSHQGDPFFSRESRNRQCTANACVAIAYLSMKPIAEWDDDDLGLILIAGDTYYKQCREKLQDEDEIYLSADELLPTLSMWSHSFLLDFKVDATVGLVNASDEKCVPDGYFGSLRSGVESFFQLHSSGILTCETELSISIWKVQNFYYIFDSHQRGPKGYPAYRNGKAIVLRFKNMDDMISHLPVSLLVRKNYLDFQYSITAVSCSIQQVPTHTQVVDMNEAENSSSSSEKTW